jgi:hypothetical protein
MMSGAVHKSPGIYLTAEGNYGKRQLGEPQMMSVGLGRRKERMGRE